MLSELDVLKKDMDIFNADDDDDYDRLSEASRISDSDDVASVTYSFQGRKRRLLSATSSISRLSSDEEVQGQNKQSKNTDHKEAPQTKPRKSSAVTKETKNAGKEDNPKPKSKTCVLL